MTTKEMIAIMKAYEEGKTIECRSYECDIINHEAGWAKIDAPGWNWEEYEYRVKTEPAYRPYKDSKEFIDDAAIRMAHIKCPFSGIWIANKENSEVRMVTSYSDIGVQIGLTWGTFEILLNNGFVYLDGTPFGIKEE